MIPRSSRIGGHSGAPRGIARAPILLARSRWRSASPSRSRGTQRATASTARSMSAGSARGARCDGGPDRVASRAGAPIAVPLPLPARRRGRVRAGHPVRRWRSTRSARGLRRSGLSRRRPRAGGPCPQHHRLVEVLGARCRGPRKIREGPRDSQGPIETPRGERASVERPQPHGEDGARRVCAKPRGRGPGVRTPVKAAESRARRLPRSCNAGGDDATRLARVVHPAADGAHVDVKIDAVEERTGESTEVPTPRHRRARTPLPRSREPSARAGVRRHDELESGGVSRGTCGPMQHDLARLERLAQGLENARGELRGLVEEEDSRVRAGDRPRSREMASSPNDRRGRRRVVRRLKRADESGAPPPGRACPQSSGPRSRERRLRGRDPAGCREASPRASSCPRRAARP